MENKDSKNRVSEMLDKIFGETSKEFPDIKINDKPFHITIKDNRTGETLVDSETDCIVGAYQDSTNDGAYTIGMSACKSDSLFSTCKTAKKCIKSMTANAPPVATFIY